MFIFISLLIIISVNNDTNINIKKNMYIYSSDGMGSLIEVITSLRLFDNVPSETDLIACIGIIKSAIELSLDKIPKIIGK